MNISSWINHQFTLYLYIKTSMHLIYQNAFKRCINTWTFHDNRLFLICSVDGLSQILEYLLIYIFYLFSACTCIFVWDLMSDLVTCKFDKDPIKNEWASVETIRILHWREVQIKYSVPRVTIWHHEAVPSDAKQWSRGTEFSISTEHSCLAYLSIPNVSL